MCAYYCTKFVDCLACVYYNYQMCFINEMEHVVTFDLVALFSAVLAFLRSSRNSAVC